MQKNEERTPSYVIEESCVLDQQKEKTEDKIEKETPGNF